MESTREANKIICTEGEKRETGGRRAWAMLLLMGWVVTGGRTAEREAEGGEGNR
jgi:hypothetical protein